MTAMTEPEMRWLLLTIAWTGLLWIPYIAQLMVQLGPVAAVWDPTGAHPHEAAWALRAKRAHYNAVENLVLFAPLVLMIHEAQLGDGRTATACAVYFAARVAHYVIHVAAVPVLRTLAFLVAWGATAVLALRVVGWV